MEIAIVTATYRRKDGRTPFLLKRMIDSVFEQEHKDWRMYVIGDRYEEDGEIKRLMPKEVFYENVGRKSERYSYSGKRLWCCGGWFATNFGIMKAMADGFDYICLLDHDEWWGKSHLKAFAENGPFAWACTLAQYQSGMLPRIETKEKVVEFLPKPEGVIKSSVCMNMRELPLFMRLVYEEDGEDVPSDADLWRRARSVIERKGARSIFINELSCFREGEQYVIKEFGCDSL